jgi:hypothetical protein
MVTANPLLQGICGAFSKSSFEMLFQDHLWFQQLNHPRVKNNISADNHQYYRALKSDLVGESDNPRLPTRITTP